MIDPQNLTIDAALDVCQPIPKDRKCAICLGRLTTHVGVRENCEDGIVTTKLCGDKHHFH
jgi:hypothetical protein